MTWNKKSNSQFIEELKLKRPDVHTEDTYVNGKVKLNFKCLTCFHTWKCTPSHILNDKTQCPKCVHKNQSAERVWSKEYLQSVIDKTGSGIVVIGEYLNAHTKIEVVCKNGHKSYCLQSNLVRGSQCKQCFGYAKFDPDRAVILYYVKIVREHKSYYKIGLTQRDVKRRFNASNEFPTMKILMEEVYENPLLGYEAEQSILKVFKEFITKDKVLRKGNSEIFSCDVLHLDNDAESLWL